MQGAVCEQIVKFDGQLIHENGHDCDRPSPIIKSKLVYGRIIKIKDNSSPKWIKCSYIFFFNLTSLKYFQLLISEDIHGNT